jgi:hypothetical protein
MSAYGTTQTYWHVRFRVRYRRHNGHQASG